MDIILTYTIIISCLPGIVAIILGFIMFFTPNQCIDKGYSNVVYCNSKQCKYKVNYYINKNEYVYETECITCRELISFCYNTLFPKLTSETQTFGSFRGSIIFIVCGLLWIIIMAKCYTIVKHRINRRHRETNIIIAQSQPNTINDVEYTIESASDMQNIVIGVGNVTVIVENPR